MSVAAAILDDESLADVRVEFGMARAEFAVRAANLACAELWAAVLTTLREAREHPEVFLGPRAAPDADFAERAAAADLAVRLSMSEGAVRGIAVDAGMLRRLPALWARFCDGDVCPANARYAAELARSLPGDAAQLRAFDEALADAAARLAPARFRVRARAARERVHEVSLSERTRAASIGRGVWIENDLDGMAWLSMKLPADVAHRAHARIDAAARHLAGADGETRTLAQLRADVAGELLAGTHDAGTTVPRPAAGVSVAVTVPVLTLLGGDAPGTLEGYGPIDAETARRLAGQAPSFTRLLTDPVSGALLEVDRRTYRPPADLKRALELVDTLCAFPGCGRGAGGCDLDHTVAWQDGGTTRLGNLAHLCRHHHRLKHESGWKVERGPDRRLTWTSPTGHEREADPPPF